MTEEEWLGSQDPQPFWRYLEMLDRTPRRMRKTRLLACALASLAWNVHGDLARRIIRSIERYADCELDSEDFQALMTEFVDQPENDFLEQAESNSKLSAHAKQGVFCIYALSAARNDNYIASFAVSLGYQALSARGKSWLFNLAPEICDCIRDIFGNPFRSSPLDSDWLDANHRACPKIAKQMYEMRDFSNMPALADALEDAGCRDASILEHCRSDEGHARGCWVVDLILGN